MPISTHDTGYIEECIANSDKRSLLIFLMQTLNSTVFRLNPLKGCIELYPNIPDTDEQEDDEDD